VIFGPVRVMAWNLGHQTRSVPIHPGFMGVVEGVAPDVLVLNEFVDEDRADLRRDLRSIGLNHISSSRRHGRHNQVLVASRHAFSAGTLSGPSIAGGAGESNFLHASFDIGLEVVGLRAPTYVGAQRTEYWSRLSASIRTTKELPIVWIGDLNADPLNKRSFGGRYLAELASQGWEIPRADGQWSFYRGSRIDHALMPQCLHCISARYLTNSAGVEFVGALDGYGRYVSDHAALVLDLARKTPLA
jgi:hypothetical protein